MEIPEIDASSVCPSADFMTFYGTMQRASFFGSCTS